MAYSRAVFAGTLMASPFLRWAGSKRQHVPFLRRYWSPTVHRRYIEPFAGSAALFFALAPPRAVLGDLNGELIRAYRTVRNDPDGVHRRLIRFATGRTAYDRIRATRHGHVAWKAARFVYLNRFCFNGLYRTNLLGRFNVPYGAPKNDHLPGLDQLRQCANLLSRARLMHADFRRPLLLVEPGDFVYMDPPYAVSRRRVFVQYSRQHFGADDLDDLAAGLEEIDRRGASFILSYADSHEARRLFRRWKRRRFAVRRNVAGFASARRNHYELFVSNINGF
jgi:DNA adenine methylase